MNRVGVPFATAALTSQASDALALKHLVPHVNDVVLDFVLVKLLCSCELKNLES